MRLTCERDDLIQCMQMVSRAMPSRSPLEILDGVYFKATSERTILRCTDTVLSIEADLPCMVQEGGEIVLPGRLFSEIVRKLPEGIVSIEMSGSTVKITCSGSKMTLQGIDAATFPELPVVNDESPLSFPEQALKELILQTNFAIGQDETQPVLMGELMEIEGEKVTMVALDGYRMAIASLTLPGAEQKQGRLVIPGKSLSEIARLFGDAQDKRATLSLSSTQAVVDMGQTRVVTRLIEGDYINYRQILPTSYQTRLTVNTQALLDAVERASLLAREGRNNLIKIEIKEQALFVSANGERGNTLEDVDIEMEGKPLEIAFNARYLLDVLKVVKDQRIAIEFISDRSPCVIAPLEGDAYVYIVLPVRLQG